MATILVVDDEPLSRLLLCEILRDEGHEVALAQDAAQAREYRNRFRPDLVLLDVWLRDTDGITLLQEWSRREQLRMPVLMLSGQSSIESAVRATQLGAAGYLEKQVALRKLLHALEHSLAAVTPGAKPVRTTAADRSPPLGTPPKPEGGTAFPVPAIVLPEADQSFDLNRPQRETREDFERSYFEFHLVHEVGNITRVAEKSGLERTHLYRKLKQLGLDAWRREHRPVVSTIQTTSVGRLTAIGNEPSTNV